MRDNRLNLFRFNQSSGETKQLTFGRDSETPVCTPDATTVIYQDYSGPSLLKVSTNGGTATNTFGGADVSRDGKQLVFIETVGSGKEQRAQIVIQNLELVSVSPRSQLLLP